MNDPKSATQQKLDESWEECIEDRENRRKDEEFWKAIMESEDSDDNLSVR